MIATCGDCDKCWRGPNAHSNGGWREIATGHTRQYAQDNQELDNEGVVSNEEATK